MRQYTAVLALLAGLAPAALAQQGPPVPEYNPADGGAPARDVDVNATFSLRARYALASEFNEGEGDVSVGRVGADADVRIGLAERHTLIVSFGSEFSAYDFGEATSIAGTNEPWDDVLAHSVGVTYRGRVTDQWGVILGVSALASYQQGADVSDSITFGGRVGGTYSASENFTIGLGVLVSSRLEENTIIIPFPILDWTITKQWAVRTGRGSTRSLRLEVAYTPIEELTLSLGGGVEAREFRLDDSGPIPDGVGRDWRAPVSLAAEWRVGKQLTILAEVGADLWQNYTIDDTTGAELADVDADIAIFAGVGVRLNF